MVREFKLPDVGEGVAEGELLEWHVAVGDTVTEDQVVAEVETDKAVVDVPSPVNGTVRELLAEPGDIVPVGDVLLTFDVEGEASEESEASADASGAGEQDATAETETAAVSDEAATESDTEEAVAAADSSSASGQGGRVFAAPTARRLARELGVDIASVAGSGPGGRVTEGDVRAAAESGGAAGGGAESGGADGAESDGKQLKSAVTRIGDDGDGEESDDVESVVSEVESGGATGNGEGAGTTQAPSVEAAGRNRTLAAPATRRVADELDVDIDDVPTDETRDGEPHVTESAVREYAEAQKRAQAADAEAVASRGGAEAETSDEALPAASKQQERREPYRGVRKTIGEAMQRSKFTAPHVTHFDKVDATALVEAREKLKPRAEERGVKLTYVPFVMKAVVAALQEHPVLNTSLDEENEEIVYKEYYNIGVAAATDAGLMVPVVDDVDQKGLLQLASETNERVQKARDRSIALEEMQGGTFTITNFGAIGGEYASPIINYPETAILGLGAIKERPMAVDGEVVARDVLTLSLSIDHRVVDGADAARFVNTLTEYLEDPLMLLLE